MLYAVKTRSTSESPCPVFPLNAGAVPGRLVCAVAGTVPGESVPAFRAGRGRLPRECVAPHPAPAPSGFPAEEALLDRVRGGSYEGAIAVAAALTAVAISLKFSGLSVSVAFLIEAELLFFAGLYYRQSFLRQLATALLGVSVVRLIVVDVPGSGHMTLAGTTWNAWSPVALLHAGVFYLNRFLMARGAYYGHAAAALLMLVLGFELPFEFVGLGWLVLSLGLYELGIRKRLEDFALQSYWVGGVSLVMLVAKSVLATGTHTDWHGWMPQICAAILLYGAAVRLRLRGRATGQPTSPP